MDNAVDRHVFYISDGTAITAEVLGHAVMSQLSLSAALRCRLSKMRAVHGQWRIRLTQFITRQVCARWSSTPSCCRRFALSSCKVKAFARISFRRWLPRYNKRWNWIQRRLLIVPMALTLIISINMMRALRRLITPLPTMTVFRCAIWTRLRWSCSVFLAVVKPHQSVSGNAIWYPRGKLPLYCRRYG